ncbi:MAG: 30S ribosomal protein S6 [Geminicoccaceae bacterium]|nr:30S ribosomal protein S6 [Geminicoccaceae bacterium]
MSFYEHTLIARPDLTSQQAQTLAEEMAQIVQTNGGEVKKTEYWGLRTLAYRVTKNRKGHYLHLNIDAPAGVIDELERNERISEDVIRYLTVRVDGLEEGPSIVMQVRTSRDDRRRDRN